MHGTVYTPVHIVTNILNLLGYNEGIIKHHIIDNSCGEGAFLVEVVNRYCQDYFRQHSDITELGLQLESYIHGIDTDKNAIEECILALNTVTKQYKISNVKWDIHFGNTLEIDRYDNKMDFVVGNPPYVRVHNLQDNYRNVKNYSFTENGMTDLYIVFYEIGFQMLNSEGKMGLITPSSFLRSLAGTKLREYIYKNKTLTKVVDLGHFQAFSATTYTMITIFFKSNQDHKIEYYIYDKDLLIPKIVDYLNYEDIFINGKMYFSKFSDLTFLREVENNHISRVKREIIVKNGFATLADKVFIGNFNFNSLVIDILKASTGKWYKCLYPYDEMGNPLSFNDIKKFMEPYDYLIQNKDSLMKRDSENKDEWYLFGRSQAIKDVFIEKIAINTTIKDINSLKIETVPAGSGIYSGLYIISNHSEKEIRDVLETDEFINYLKLLKNYKSGGYYSFSSSDLEKFLSIKLEDKSNGQPRLFESIG